MAERRTTILAIAAVSTACTVAAWILSQSSPQTVEGGGVTPKVVTNGDSIEFAGLSPMDGPLSSTRLTSEAPSPSAVATVTQEVTAVAGGPALPWSEAKQELRADFEADEALTWAMSRVLTVMDADDSELVGLKRSIHIDDPEIDWNECISVDGSAPNFSSADLEDIRLLSEQAREALVPLSKEAMALLGDALHEYWKGDMGYRIPSEDSSLIPEEFWASKGGTYNLKYEAMAAGWKIGVNLDSAEFPVLEDTLQQAEQVKKHFFRSVIALAR